MKYWLILIFCFVSGQLFSQQFIERVHLKDSVTVYEGYIIEQAPAKYVKIYRLKEKDTLQIALIDVWKITKLYNIQNKVQKKGQLLAQLNKRYYKSFFAEVGGRAILYSANFDMRTERGRRNGWGINAGLGIVGSTGNFGVAVLVPFGANYLIGKKKSFIEVGAGATYMFLIGNDTSSNVVWGIGDFAIPEFEGSLFGNFTLGYRHMPLANGITWRVTFNPAILGQRFLPFFGVGIGYQFW
jgi:hypothetical protein